MDENNASNSGSAKRDFALQPEYIVHRGCPGSTVLDVNYMNLVVFFGMYSQSSLIIDSADKLLTSVHPWRKTTCAGKYNGYFDFKRL